MSLISSLMTQDHRDCDHEFALAESLVARRDWDAAAKAVNAFAAALETHFSAEEEQLFPRFEAVTGMTHGPTEVMRGEHADMRSIIANLKDALARRDADDFAGEAETLLIMMQQHNMKEENILYPMCDARLATERDALTEALGQRITRKMPA